jgi:hypothetical protein
MYVNNRLSSQNLPGLRYEDLCKLISKRNLSYDSDTDISINDDESVVSNFSIDDASSVVSNFIIDDNESVVSNFEIDNASVTSEQVDDTEYTLDEYLLSLLPKQVLLWTGEAIDIVPEEVEVIPHYYHLTKQNWLIPIDLVPLAKNGIIHYEHVEHLTDEIHSSMIDKILNNMSLRDSCKRVNKDQVLQQVEVKEADPTDVEYVQKWTEYLKTYNDKMEFIMHLVQCKGSPNFIKYLKPSSRQTQQKIKQLYRLVTGQIKLNDYFENPDFVKQLERYNEYVDACRPEVADKLKPNEPTGKIVLWTGETLTVRAKDYFEIRRLLREHGPNKRAPKSKKYINDIQRHVYHTNPDLKRRVADSRRASEARNRNCLSLLRELMKNNAIHVCKRSHEKLSEIIKPATTPPIKNKFDLEEVNKRNLLQDKLYKTNANNAYKALKELHDKGKLKVDEAYQERIDTLMAPSELLQKYRERSQQEWLTQLGNLKQYESNPSSFTDPNLVKKIKMWIAKQKLDYKKGKVSEERIILLRQSNNWNTFENKYKIITN